MDSWIIRWSVILILLPTGSLQADDALAPPTKPSDGRHVVALAPLVTHGLEQPVYLTHAGDGSTRLFVVEQPGRIRVLEANALRPGPFLDVTERVLSGGERGLLGLAFHPNYHRNGRFFVNYTRKP